MTTLEKLGVFNGNHLKREQNNIVLTQEGADDLNNLFPCVEGSNFSPKNSVHFNFNEADSEVGELAISVTIDGNQGEVRTRVFVQRDDWFQRLSS